MFSNLSCGDLYQRTIKSDTVSTTLTMLVPDVDSSGGSWVNITQEEYDEFIERYLGCELGVKYLPLRVVLPLTLAYVTIFVTGILGNVATCAVIIKKPTMQTATNYYLFSLAISDLTLLLLGLPNELSLFWQQYPWVLGVAFCKIRSYVSEMSSYVSVLTIVAFSMERYLAICHPLHLHAMSGLKRPMRFILGSWMVALVSAIPFAVYMKVDYIDYPEGSRNWIENSATCGLPLKIVQELPLVEFSSIIFFFVPMIVILVLYTRMGLEIRRSNRSAVGHTVESHVHGKSRQIQSRKSVIRMLSAVVVMFFLCWAPFHAQRLLFVWGRKYQYFRDLDEWLYTLSGCLYYFSATVNPILYTLMSVKYRRAFKDMLCCPSKVTGKIIDSNGNRGTSVCQCDSSDGNQLTLIRSSRYPSIRCTIHHAKEMICTPKKVNGNEGAINGVTPRTKQNDVKEPLINNRSSDNSNVGDKHPVEVSYSTASSTL